jgi:tetratricopeptide (TPR) repeat protein
VLGASAEDKLQLELIDESEAVLAQRSVPMNLRREGTVLETFELADMTGGRYLLRGQLVGPEGRVLAEKTAPVQVSPRNAIARPWVHRRSFDTNVPGLLPLTLGEQLLTSRRIELAQKALEVAVAANNPDLPQARWRLAGIYIGWREPDRALELLQPLEPKFPNQYEVVTGLGFAHYLQEDFTNAVDYLERAATIRPPGTSLLNALGDCHRQLGQSDRAREAFERSLELNPNQEEIRGKLDSMIRKND